MDISYDVKMGSNCWYFLIKVQTSRIIFQEMHYIFPLVACNCFFIFVFHYWLLLYDNFQMFKGFEKLKDVQYVYTPFDSSLCGVKLEANNKKQYLLTGKSQKKNHFTYKNKSNCSMYNLIDFAKICPCKSIFMYCINNTNRMKCTNCVKP